MEKSNTILTMNGLWEKIISKRKEKKPEIESKIKHFNKKIGLNFLSSHHECINRKN